jgi:predicted RNA-binding protein with PIN domain
MNISITFTPRQQTAFTKRVTGNATAESLAATIVTDQAEQWANSDRGADVFSVIAADFKKLSATDAKAIEDIAAKLRSAKVAAPAIVTK